MKRLIFALLFFFDCFCAEENSSFSQKLREDLNESKKEWNENKYIMFPESAYLNTEQLNQIDKETTKETKNKIELKYHEIDNDYLRSLLKEIHFYERKIINKETLRVLLYKILILQAENPMLEEKVFFSKVVEKILSTTEENINVDDLYKFFEGEIFENAIKELLKDTVGEESANEYLKSKGSDL